MTRRSWIAAGAGLFVAVLLGIALGSGGDETPAPPAVLNRIADRNDDAAADAGARMKAESEAATQAVDARLKAAEAAQAPPEEGSAPAPP